MSFQWDERSIFQHLCLFNRMSDPSSSIYVFSMGWTIHLPAFMSFQWDEWSIFQHLCLFNGMSDPSSSIYVFSVGSMINLPDSVPFQWNKKSTFHALHPFKRTSISPSSYYALSMEWRKFTKMNGISIFYTKIFVKIPVNILSAFRDI